MDAINFFFSLTDASALKDGLERIAIRVGNLYFIFTKFSTLDILTHFIGCKEDAVLSMHNFKFLKSDIY